MEVALARLVGAGLTLVFEGFEEPAPAGAVENGFLLIRHIARERPEAISTLTEGVVRDIWREWRHAKLPRDVALAHVDAMPTLMEVCRSNEGMMLGAVAAIQVAKRTGATARIAGHTSRVATSIIGQAIENGFLTGRGLNESIAYFFLDRLLTRLMPDHQLFQDLRPQFRSYVDQAPWLQSDPATIERELTEPADTADDSAAEPLDISEPAAIDTAAAEAMPVAAETTDAVVDATAAAALDIAAPAPAEASEPASADLPDAALPVVTLPEPTTSPASEPTPTTDSETAATPAPTASEQAEIARLATDLDVPQAALAAAARSATQHLGENTVVRLDEIARNLRQLLSTLEHPADGNAMAADCKHQAAIQLTAGDIGAADQLLADAEDVHLKSAPLDLGNVQSHLMAAAATRSMRADLSLLGGDYRRAARHLASAARCLPETERLARRNYLVRQANALVSLGETDNDTTALSEAAQIYADAGRQLSEQESPLDWASAHLDLGNVLMVLGEREGRPERFLAAALHFKPASDVFSRERQTDNWARAQLGLADALRSQGEVQGDVVTLSEAAFAYRAALGVATRDRMPSEWRRASYRLAVTLMRLDNESREIAHHEEAVMALRAVIAAGSVDDGPDTIRALAMALLAEALLALSKARAEPWLADEALTMVREGHLAVAGAPANQRAALDDRFGTTLCILGESQSSAELIAEATDMKLAALDQFTSAGDTANAERVRGELLAIEEALQSLVPTAALETAGAAA